MAVFLNDPLVNRTEAHLVSKSLVVSMALYSKRKRMEGVWATQMNHPSRRQHERRRSSLVLLKTTKHSTKGASVDLGSDSPPMPPVRDPNKTALEDKTLVGTPLLLTPIQFVETQSIVVELDDSVVWIESDRAVLLLRHSAGRPLLWQLSTPSGMVAVYFEEKEAPTPMKARYLRPWSASVSAPAPALSLPLLPLSTVVWEKARFSVDTPVNLCCCCCCRVQCKGERDCRQKRCCQSVRDEHCSLMLCRCCSRCRCCCQQ